jgi:hypothetical protein
VKRFVVLSSLALLVSQTAGLAQDPLQGRIESRNGLSRLNRPAMPSRPLGDAMEHLPPSASGGHHKSGFDLAASSVSNLLDKQAFNFGNTEAKADSSKSAVKGGIDATDRELVVAWEEWHKRLCSTIYHYWLTYGNIPGEGSVRLNVTRDGEIAFMLEDYHVSPFEQFSPQQRDMFDHAIAQTLQYMSHTDVLIFPEKSQRKDVTLSTKFSFSEQDDGPQGYTWKKGDYEHVHDSQ